MAVLLNPLSCEIMDRLHQKLSESPGTGLFGQIVQRVIAACLAAQHGSGQGTFVEQPGAGVPDCKATTADGRYAWEIKHTTDGKISLSDRDVDGMHVDGQAAEAKARLIVLDVRYPARIWVIDSKSMEPGDLRLETCLNTCVPDEETALAAKFDQLVRTADTAVLDGDADHAKACITDAIAMLGWAEPRRTG